jgi:hypothetical protein
VVSCITADVIPADGVSAGAKLLKTLLSSSEDGGHVSNEANADSLLADLALRLQKLGARVDSSFAERLPLVATHGSSSAVVMPDWALVGQTLSEKLRLRSDLLKRIGWRYIRVHSFELFSDPQAVALRIAEQLGMQISQRPQPLFENERAFEDTDAAWGDRTENNDDRLRGDVPPHWQSLAIEPDEFRSGRYGIDFLVVRLGSETHLYLFIEDNRNSLHLSMQRLWLLQSTVVEPLALAKPIARQVDSECRQKDNLGCLQICRLSGGLDEAQLANAGLVAVFDPAQVLTADHRQ